MTRSRFIRLLRLIAIIVVAAILVGYAIWRSFAYARGPVINVFQPISGSTVSSTTMEIVGRADRVSSLTLDGNPISIDEAGNFSETIAVFAGTNMITLDATDQFGRSVEKMIEVVGQ